MRDYMMTKDDKMERIHRSLRNSVKPVRRRS